MLDLRYSIYELLYTVIEKRMIPECDVKLIPFEITSRSRYFLCYSLTGNG